MSQPLPNGTAEQFLSATAPANPRRGTMGLTSLVTLEAFQLSFTCTASYGAPVEWGHPMGAGLDPGGPHTQQLRTKPHVQPLCPRLPSHPITPPSQAPH